jgi:hypothetical protein
MSIKDQIDNEREERIFGGEKIEIPFDVLYFSWSNGSPKASKDNSGVSYYGGWYTDANKISERGIAPIQKLHAEEWYDKDGRSFQVYATRFLTVSVIAKRFRWMINPNDQSDKGRAHGQILCLCANTYKDNSKKQIIEYWMPCVLTAKGYAYREIESAFLKFEKATAEIRSIKFYGAPAWLFWNHIGTFGNERISVEVGTRKKNNIVPAQITIPSNLNPEIMEKLYIGDELSELRRKLKQEASEWIHAWDIERGKNPSSSFDHGGSFDREDNSEIPF